MCILFIFYCNFIVMLWYVIVSIVSVSFYTETRGRSALGRERPSQQGLRRRAYGNEVRRDQYQTTTVISFVF